MQRLDFTIEPFVDGQPGAHVTAPVAALEALGVTVDFGAFGSTCIAEAEQMPELVAEVVRVAYANGATRVTIEIDGVSVDGA
ncbi:MAG: hypothetical protein O2925_02935 [Actinomycetota bacterium]|nr:hypothetical protein [Actinomycetota bacterium]MDA3015189.1 hypothetical protein [Actinomycetota bacterium]MDA3027728.1 hypothetical protein [Actinomycetota bacterium]